MNRKQMAFEDFRELLATRLRQVGEAQPDEQDRLARRAWTMVQRDVPWGVILAATRGEAAVAAVSGVIGAATNGSGTDQRSLSAGLGQHTSESPANGPTRFPVEAGASERYALVDPRDLAEAPAPPLRHEVGRYERERLSATTRQAIRMARHARRWHEIRKMRSVLLNIDQGYLKRMLGAESDSLSQEINALLRSWAPLIRERQQGGRAVRKRR